MKKIFFGTMLLSIVNIRQYLAFPVNLNFNKMKLHVQKFKYFYLTIKQTIFEWDYIIIISKNYLNSFSRTKATYVILKFLEIWIKRYNSSQKKKAL